MPPVVRAQSRRRRRFFAFAPKRGRAKRQPPPSRPKSDWRKGCTAFAPNRGWRKRPFPGGPKTHKVEKEIPTRRRARQKGHVFPSSRPKAAEIRCPPAVAPERGGAWGVLPTAPGRYGEKTSAPRRFCARRRRTLCALYRRRGGGVLFFLPRLDAGGEDPACQPRLGAKAGKIKPPPHTHPSPAEFRAIRLGGGLFCLPRLGAKAEKAFSVCRVWGRLKKTFSANRVLARRRGCLFRQPRLGANAENPFPPTAPGAERRWRFTHTAPWGEWARPFLSTAIGRGNHSPLRIWGRRRGGPFRPTAPGREWEGDIPPTEFGSEGGETFHLPR